MMGEKVCGIIPARGGSKGVLRKNIRRVAERPLIAYTIEAARQSQVLTDYLVSTDDEEIARVARREGAAVLMRPAALAADDTPMVPVIKHALAHQGACDVVVILQPTTPLRTAADIDTAVHILRDTGADTVVSVYEVADHHPSRMYKLHDNCLIPYDQEPPNRLRQSLSPVYHRNGAVYVCRAAMIWEQETTLGAHLRPYIMPRTRSVNIDDEFDLAIADFLLRCQRGTAPFSSGCQTPSEPPSQHIPERR
jgi:CMP-N,N'-diacetyllegionaminic acid synthase